MEDSLWLLLSTHFAHSISFHFPTCCCISRTSYQRKCEKGENPKITKIREKPLSSVTSCMEAKSLPVHPLTHFWPNRKCMIHIIQGESYPQTCRVWILNHRHTGQKLLTEPPTTRKSPGLKIYKERVNDLLLFSSPSMQANAGPWIIIFITIWNLSIEFESLCFVYNELFPELFQFRPSH